MRARWNETLMSEATMKRLNITLSALLAAALILSPAAAENLDLLKPLMKTTTPSGNGPFPAVLFLSGASGFHIEGGNYDGVQDDLTRLPDYPALSRAAAIAL